MLRATFKNLLARKLRLLMSAFAIVLGVGFVAGSLIFTDTLSRTFDSIMTGTVSDVVVRPEGGIGDDFTQSNRMIDAAVLDEVAAVDGVASAEGSIVNFGTFVIGADGKVVGGQGAPGLAFNYSEGESAAGEPIISLVEGRAPQREGEVVIDEGTAERAGHRVGDEISLASSGAEPLIKAELVGTIRFGENGLAGASLTFFDQTTAQKYFLEGKDEFNELAITGEDGRTQESVRAAVADVLPRGLEAETGDVVADEQASDINQALGFITTFLLVFAGIALFVGSFLIINTFSILVAQRSRELALFRAIGAKRSQVTRSVLAEAFVVGLVGSTAGLALGVGLAQAIKALFARFGLDLGDGGLVFAPRTVLAAYAVGMIVTLLAAYLPARRAGKIAPVAAMRDEPIGVEGSLRGRVLIGVVVIIVGAGALGAGLFLDVSRQIWWIGGGIFGVVLGAALISPVIGRPVIAVIGWLYRRLFGTVGRMAEQNAVRNPRRTAATASALMIGLTLVSMMSVFGQSTKASIDKQISESFAADYVVSNAIGQPFSPAVTQDVAGVPGVDAVSPVRYVSATVRGERRSIGGIDPATIDRVQPIPMDEGRLADLGDSEILVLSEDRAGRSLGDAVEVTVAGKTSRVTIAGFFEEAPALGGLPYLMTNPGLERAGAKAADNFAFVVADPGASGADLKRDITQVLTDQPMLTLKDQGEYAAEQRAPIDQMLFIIYALLGLAIVIAVLGIVNTLALSVMERTREIGLLRAVGLSRRQLRRMIRLEAVVIALLGATLGVVLGVGFGVALQRALVDDGITELAIPWAYLAGFVLIAGVVGVLAALWPAWRASRLNVLRAIATE
ncbi:MULTISPECIES: ABC transporter permease [unclassified Janibacter]|uniref:ABC transporter permease n=1 Tax=unclassified Janibacter TaxID=2649294 RepID=UPI003D069975